MNAVREKILSEIMPYKDFAKHKDLVAFTVGADYFSYDYETDAELEADFEEVVAVVEKDWLFKYMTENDDIENPLEYLQSEYTWDDSCVWFDEALAHNKLVVVDFN